VTAQNAEPRGAREPDEDPVDPDLDPGEVPSIDSTGVVEAVGHELDRVEKPPDLALVVFGASGDLAARKLMPALEGLCDHGALPEHFNVIGVARTKWSDEEFRSHVLESTPGSRCEAWPEVVAKFRYVAGEYGAQETFDQLKTVLDETDEKMGTAGNRIYYLATVPDMFGPVATALGKHGCNLPGVDGKFARLVVEKPFGRDLESALALDATIHASFDEDQIYRIDHYMGKETVQNVLALRFANAVFEPVWNRRFVDHIQITVAEQLGVEHRGGFY
jgi:glucose-6-phosphate 1-dehydrogenase